MRRTVLGAALALVVLAGGYWLAAPGAGVTRDRYGDLEQTLPVGQLPEFARTSPYVEAMYRFAASPEGEALETVPCYCGCNHVGHVHNRHCYLKQQTAQAVTFTGHGAG